jgi:hypothetical protein
MTTNEWPMVDVLRLKALHGHRLWFAFPTATKACAIFGHDRGRRADGRTLEGAGLFRARL